MRIANILCLPLILFSLTAIPALADGKAHGKKPATSNSALFCPPGLAKKSPACIPPGQAKKHARTKTDDHANPPIRYRVGDIARGDCIIVPSSRYQSLPAGTYCRSSGQLLRIDPETRAILTAFRLLANN